MTRISPKDLRIQHDYDVLHLFDGPQPVWTTQEISKALGLLDLYVVASCKRLVKAGKLKDVKTGRQRLSRWAKV